MPRASARGVKRLMGYAADRFAALAAWRVTHKLWEACARRRSGQRSSNDSAAAEDVEDQRFEGCGGVDGHVAYPVASAERFDGPPPLVQALAVEPNGIVVQRHRHGCAAF